MVNKNTKQEIMKKLIGIAFLATLLASCGKNEEQVRDFDIIWSESLKNIDKTKIKPELGEIKPDPTQIGIWEGYTQGDTTIKSINW